MHVCFVFSKRNGEHIDGLRVQPVIPAERDSRKKRIYQGPFVLLRHRPAIWGPTGDFDPTHCEMNAATYTLPWRIQLEK